MARTLLVAVVAALASASCGEVARTGRAPVMLVVNSLEGSPGGGDDFSTFLQSDVLTNGSIFNDTGRATLSMALKNPGTVTSPLGPSQLNSVTISRYRVRFIRADGRNTPGVDVPYGFDGAVTATIPPGGTVTVGFELVRHQMKLEPPVSTLRNSGGAGFIHTIAAVTFFGRDLAGNDIEATGTLGVSFADFADPE